MQEKMNRINDDAWDIDPEEFDRVREVHVFSEEYCRRKKKMIRKYCRSRRMLFGKYTVQAAITLLGILVLLVPFSVYAETVFLPELSQHTQDMFVSELVLSDPSPVSGILSKQLLSRWIGWLWKDADDGSESVAETDQTVSEEDGFMFRDVFDEPVVIPIGDTTMEVLAAFSDGKSSGVVVFTLEKEGGVTLLTHDPQGGYGERELLFSREDHYLFHFESAFCQFYEDEFYSTDSKRYYYGYMSFQEDAAGEDHLTLKLMDYSCTMGEYWDRTYGLELEIRETPFEIPLVPVPKRRMEDSYGKQLEISPFSMQIYGLDPYGVHFSRIDRISIRFKDGREYVVLDDVEGKYQYNEAFSSSEGFVDIFFDRLVDLDEVEFLCINGSEYRTEQGK